MKWILRATTCFGLLLPNVVVGSGINFSGHWKIRSLGDFRDVHIVHKTNKIEARRELWPEFQGERYKLEHLYRGRIVGTDIRGRLFVREDGVGKFENLRAFIGSVQKDGTLVLDGMPMQRSQ